MSERAAEPLDLARALERVSEVVDRLQTAMDGGDVPDGIQAPQFRREISRAVNSLSAELDRAADIVVARQAHAAWRRDYGADTWPERDHRIRHLLSEDRDSGTMWWIGRCAVAIGAGAWAECWRLLGGDYQLADWAAWVPDRTAAVLVGIERAAQDPQRSAEALSDLVETLRESEAGAGDRLLGAMEALDAHWEDWPQELPPLLLVAARVLALAKDERAVAVLDTARQAVRLHGESQDATGARIWTTESFLERQGVAPGALGSAFASAAPRTHRDLAVVHELVQRRLEEVSRARPEEGTASEAAADLLLLQQAQDWVDALLDVGGSVERVQALLEEPADELTLALVTRLVRERQLADAEELLGRLWAPGLATSLRLPAAELRVQLAEARQLDAEELASVVAEAADQALWARDTPLAVRGYERSLALRPDHPDTLRSLADALQADATPKDAARRLENLTRALDLCAQAAELEPVAPASSWAALVVRSARLQLMALDPRRRGVHTWEMLAASTEATRTAPETEDRWSLMVDDLTELRLFAAAHLAARHYRRLVGAGPDSDRQLVITLLNLGRGPESLALLEALEPLEGEDPGWLAALRGYAHCLQHDVVRAEEEFDRAIAANPSWLRYRAWAAHCLTAHAVSSAEDLWRSVWRDADLDDMDEVQDAAWAALFRGSLQSARELAQRARAGEDHAVGVRHSELLAGLTEVCESRGEEGWPGVSSALSGAVHAHDLQLTTRFARAVLLRLLPDDPQAVARFDGLVEEATVGLLGTEQLSDPVGLMDRELDSVSEQLSDLLVRRTLQQLRAALRPAVEQERATAAPGQLPPGDAAGVDESADESADAAASVVMPPSWFVHVEGHEMDHEFFTQGLPLARAAARRSSPAKTVDLAVRVRVDPACEPDQVWVAAPHTATRTFRVSTGSWYCPEQWLGGLREHRRQDALPTEHAGLVSVPPPLDALERLDSWSPAETVARRVLDSVVASQDAD